MFEKYTALAKEALSSGDKTLHENYLQHADHFMRLVADKKKLQALNQTNLSNQTNPPENNLAKEVSNSPKENTNNEK